MMQAMRMHVISWIYCTYFGFVVTCLTENIILDTPKADRYLSDHAAILCKLT